MLSKFAALLLINIADGYPTLIHLGVSNDILFISIEKRHNAFFYWLNSLSLVQLDYIILDRTKKPLA